MLSVCQLLLNVINELHLYSEFMAYDRNINQNDNAAATYVGTKASDINDFILSFFSIFSSHFGHFHQRK